MNLIKLVEAKKYEVRSAEGKWLGLIRHDAKPWPVTTDGDFDQRFTDPGGTLTIYRAKDERFAHDKPVHTADTESADGFTDGEIDQLAGLAGEYLS